MSLDDQTIHFANDLDNLCQRYRDEYDITYASVVGVLQMKIHLICEEASNQEDEE